MESIITSAKRNVKFREGDERSEGGFSQKAAGDLGAEIIITAGEQNVKFEKADERSAGSFSQKATETLGMESIITSAKRIVKFEGRMRNRRTSSRRTLQGP